MPAIRICLGESIVGSRTSQAIVIPRRLRLLVEPIPIHPPDRSEGEIPLSPAQDKASLAPAREAFLFARSHLVQPCWDVPFNHR
ncbi:hypothetical protein MESS4_230034 [Mesorhizobium sp. STM 4661]|nr:hypothetical protein MESS4_230034 [Mesorhizobium sp. STM 4661]